MSQKSTVAPKQKRRTGNPRLAKSLSIYTVHEIARTFHVHKNTVRAWMKVGLRPIDSKKPILIKGADLRDFLEKRRKKNKQPCKAGEIFCMRCHAPKQPAGGMAEYRPNSVNVGTLVAICPDCDSWMYRGASFAQLGQFRLEMDVTIARACSRINDTVDPPVNSDINHIA